MKKNKQETRKEEKIFERKETQKKKHDKKQENISKNDSKNDSKEKIDLKINLQRLQAEFDNYRKRIEKEKESFKNYTKAIFIEKLFPVIDTFELALTSIKKPETKNEENIIKGMEMIFSQLLTTLETEGLQIIQPEIGKEKFDPKMHEAILTEESDKEKNIIIEVLQKGYKIGEKIIRPAKVKVAK